MSIRRKSRELALQCLYQIDQGGNQQPDIAGMKEYFDVNQKAVSYAQELVSGIQLHWEVLNRMVEDHAKNWRLSRMAVIDRNILRIAAYEIAYMNDVPSSVILNEAIEIAKRFSSDDAAPFINGILDSICRSIRKEENETNSGHD
ncbi:MAG: transcription antitermination factor NusB [Deltaproteobacteria bacterium]|nr:transcription antitermination factor NusB [Deltaproteobacteria bacterium]